MFEIWEREHEADMNRPVAWFEDSKRAGEYMAFLSSKNKDAEAVYNETATLSDGWATPEQFKNDQNAPADCNANVTREHGERVEANPFNDLLTQGFMSDCIDLYEKAETVLEQTPSDTELWGRVNFIAELSASLIEGLGAAFQTQRDNLISSAEGLLRNDEG